MCQNSERRVSEWSVSERGVSERSVSEWSVSERSVERNSFIIMVPLFLICLIVKLISVDLVHSPSIRLLLRLL